MHQVQWPGPQRAVELTGAADAFGRDRGNARARAHPPFAGDPMERGAGAVTGLHGIPQIKSRQRSDAVGGETRRAGQGELERAAGIEPTRKAWKSSALPMSYARDDRVAIENLALS